MRATAKRRATIEELSSLSFSLCHQEARDGTETCRVGALVSWRGRSIGASR